MNGSCCAALIQRGAAASVSPSFLSVSPTSNSSSGCYSGGSMSRNSSSSSSTLPRFTLKAFYQSPAASASSPAGCRSAAGAAATAAACPLNSFACPAGGSYATAVAPAAAAVSPAAAGSADVPYFQQLSVNSDGSSVCVASSSLSLLFFSPQHLLLQQQLLHAHSAQISSISFFHRNPFLMASASQDASVRLWDLRCSSSDSSGVAAAAGGRSPLQAAGHLQLGSPGSTDAEVWAVAVNFTDTLLAAGYKNGFSLMDIRCFSSPSAFCNSSSSPTQRSGVFSSSVDGVNCGSSSSTSSFMEVNRAPVAAAAAAASFSGGGHWLPPATLQQQQHSRKKKRFSQQQQLRAVVKRIETHAESINRLLFHPSLDWLLFSAGEDGLVCSHDLRRSVAGGGGAAAGATAAQQQQRTRTDMSKEQQLHEGGRGGAAAAGALQEDEENAETLCCCFLYGEPISKINIVGPQQDCLCVCSSTDDAALWQLRGLSSSSSGRHPSNSSNGSTSDSSSAISVERRAEWRDIRMHTHLRRGDSAGYLVDNFYDVSSGRFFLLGGSVDGGLLMFHANLEDLQPAAIFAAPPQQGHEAVVRGACTVGETGADGGNLLLLTCGEDGRLCAWKQESTSLSSSHKEEDCLRSSGGSDKQTRQHGDDSSRSSRRKDADVFLWRGSQHLRKGSSARFRPY